MAKSLSINNQERVKVAVMAWMASASSLYPAFIDRDSEQFAVQRLQRIEQAHFNIPQTQDPRHDPAGHDGNQQRSNDIEGEMYTQIDPRPAHRNTQQYNDGTGLAQMGSQQRQPDGKEHRRVITGE